MLGYVYSDYAEYLNNRRSLASYLFIVDNYTISWKAALQSVVALSTTEAEHTVATEPFKETIWLNTY